MKTFITFIVIFLRNIEDARCAHCVLKGDSTHVHAELMLDNPKLNICDLIIQTCPANVTNLSIFSEIKDFTYSFCLGCLSRRILPKIQTLTMRLLNVEICTNFSPDFSSNLSELYLKGCGITALPQLGTFYGFNSLRIIDLSNNLLRDVPLDLLQYSPLVTTLDLSSNRIVVLPYLLNAESSRINVSNNVLNCSCTNAWVQSHLQFVGYNCGDNILPCPPSITISAYADKPQVNVSNNSFQLSALSGASVSFGCHVSSSIFLDIFWISPIGVIPVLNTTETYAYTVEPILAETSLTVSRSSNSNAAIKITNARGHLSGIWYCIGHSPVKLIVSPAILLDIYSGLYHEGVYSISLYYGFSGMFILLLVGIIGGTIRYCSETHCLQRPQPPFAYGGQTFIGVIPVPEVDGTVKQKRSHSKEAFEYNDSLQVATERRCNLCNSHPSYWFCDKCRAIHYVESIFERIDHPNVVVEDFQCGVLSQYGKINIVGRNVDMTVKNDNPLAVKVNIPSNTVEARPLITTEALSYENELFPATSSTQEPMPKAKLVMSDIYVRSNKCMIRLGQESESSDVFSTMNNLCCHYSLRRTGADVKLVVSNEILAEEYRKALDGLANAVANPDPTRFREGLEEFRSRLRRDVGHSVKVIRGEFQDLRAKSAKGVASLLNQSSAAAQRMRAGLSHSMEQMKDGMRSVAELCGATGTVGQTISVVSIYKDENDNTLKERFVSNFVF